LGGAGAKQLWRLSFERLDLTLADHKVKVLGAGIGGLAAATALARVGADVTILEQADKISEVGAGLQISPNGAVVLQSLGLGDAIRKTAVRAKAVQLRDFRAGKPVFELDLTRQDKPQHYYFLHRADLVEMLAGAARDAGVKIRLLQCVSEVSFSDKGRARLKTAQGATLKSDILIGADGVNSPTRIALNGVSQPFFTRQVAWRAVVPALGNEPAIATVYMGPGRHLVCYPLRGGKMINIVAVEERRDWAAEGWNHPDDPANLRAAFAGFCPEVQVLLERVETLHLWGLFRHRVAPKWFKNRTAILGDAAHPTLPFMAQGASMALEDAWTLADSLQNSTEVETGLAAYQNRRHARATRVINAASKNARNYHLRLEPLRFAAHTALRLTSHIAPDMALRKFDWLYGYDVTKSS